MIDPEYIPEDLTEYLLNYSGNRKEYNNSDDGQGSTEFNWMNSSSEGSIFVPPNVTGNAASSTPIAEDEETFQDSGMSEDESDNDLSPTLNKSNKNIHLPLKGIQKPTSCELKSDKKGILQTQQKSIENIQRDNDSDNIEQPQIGSKKGFAKSNKKRGTVKSSPQTKKTKIQNGSSKAKLQVKISIPHQSERKTASRAKKTAAGTSKSKSKKSTSQIERAFSSEMVQDNTVSPDKKGSNKRSFSPDVDNANLTQTLSKKRKANKNSLDVQGSTLVKHPNEGKENSCENIEFVISSEDEPEITQRNAKENAVESLETSTDSLSSDGIGDSTFLAFQSEIKANPSKDQKTSIGCLADEDKLDKDAIPTENENNTTLAKGMINDHSCDIADSIAEYIESKFIEESSDNLSFEDSSNNSGSPKTRERKSPLKCKKTGNLNSEALNGDAVSPQIKSKKATAPTSISKCLLFDDTDSSSDEFLFTKNAQDNSLEGPSCNGKKTNTKVYKTYKTRSATKNSDPLLHGQKGSELPPVQFQEIAGTQTLAGNEHESNSVTNSEDSSRCITPISIDCSSSQETEDVQSILPEDKSTTNSIPKDNKGSPVGSQNTSFSLFDIDKEIVICLEQSRNKNIPLQNQNESSGSSLSKDCGLNRVETKTNKKSDAGKLSQKSCINVSSSQETENVTSQKREVPPQRARRTNKKLLTESKCKVKSNSCLEKSTSAKKPAVSSPRSNIIRGQEYRAKKKKYLEDLEKNVEELKKENKILKKTSKGDGSFDQTQKEKTSNRNSKEMETLIQDLKNKISKLKKEKEDLKSNAKEMDFFVQDLKVEIQTLQKEKENLIAVEDMESIVNDLKKEVIHLKKEKEALQVNAKEMDSLVCDLRNELQKEKDSKLGENIESIVKSLEDEIIMLKKEKEELQIKAKDELKELKNQQKEVKTGKNSESSVKNLKDEVTSLKKGKEHLESNAKEMELFIEDLKQDIKELTADKEGLKSSAKEMDLLVKRMKDQIKTLQKEKGDLEGNSEEMDSILNDLKEELGELKREKLENESNLKDEIVKLKKEKVDNGNNEKEMDSLIKDLKDEIIELKKEKVGHECSEKEMDLHIKDLKNEIFTLKQEKVAHESNDKETDLLIKDLKDEIDNQKKKKAGLDSLIKDLKDKIVKLKEEMARLESNDKENSLLIKDLKDEIVKLKEEKAGHESNNKEMESITKDLKNEIVKLKQERADCDSLIKDLKDEMVKLKEEKADHESNDKEMDSCVNYLKDEIVKFKNEKADYESKAREMDSLVNGLKSEISELKNKEKEGVKKHTAEIDLFVQDLKGKIGQLFKDKKEFGSILESDIQTSKVAILESKKVNDFSEKDFKGELEQLKRDKDDLMQNAENIDSSINNLKEELEQLKTEKEKSKRNAKEMVTVMQGLKEDLDELKSKNKDACYLKEYRSRKEKGDCLTTDEMAHFVKDIKAEIGYLKGLILNKSELSALIKHVGTFQGFGSSHTSSDECNSGKRKLDEASDTDTDHSSKRQKSGNVSTASAAGLCLHVNNGKMSVEFCSTCNESSSA